MNTIGAETIGTYWAKALQAAANLHFEPAATLPGVNGITLHHHGPRGPAAEVVQSDAHGKATRAYAH